MLTISNINFNPNVTTYSTTKNQNKSAKLHSQPVMDTVSFGAIYGCRSNDNTQKIVKKFVNEVWAAKKEEFATSIKAINEYAKNMLGELNMEYWSPLTKKSSDIIDKAFFNNIAVKAKTSDNRLMWLEPMDNDTLRLSVSKKVGNDSVEFKACDVYLLRHGDFNTIKYNTDNVDLADARAKLKSTSDALINEKLAKTVNERVQEYLQIFIDDYKNRRSIDGIADLCSLDQSLNPECVISSRH